MAAAVPMWIRRWDSVPCKDCGDTLDDDDPLLLPSLRGTLCGSCSVSCEGCGDSYCSGCLGHAPPAATTIALPAWRCARSAASSFAMAAWQRVVCVCTCHDEQRNEEKKMMIRRRKKLSNNLLAEPQRARRRTTQAFRREHQTARRPCDSAPPPGRNSCIPQTLATPKSAVLESVLPMIYCTSRTYSLCGKYARACRSASTISRWRSSSTGRLIGPQPATIRACYVEFAVM